MVSCHPGPSTWRVLNDATPGVSEVGWAGQSPDIEILAKQLFAFPLRSCPYDLGDPRRRVSILPSARWPGVTTPLPLPPSRQVILS